MLKRRKLFVDHSGISHLEAEPWEPPYELTEAQETYVARLELPGVDKRSVTLTLENNKTLRVRGTKQRPGEPELGAVTPPPPEDDEARRRAQPPTVLFCDIVYGFWVRTIELPGDVAVENISAMM
jgi:HSP20 family molecular chaperone IbpA